MFSVFLCVLIEGGREAQFQPPSGSPTAGSASCTWATRMLMKSPAFLSLIRLCRADRQLQPEVLRWGEEGDSSFRVAVSGSAVPPHPGGIWLVPPPPRPDALPLRLSAQPPWSSVNHCFLHPALPDCPQKDIVLILIQFFPCRHHTTSFYFLIKRSLRSALTPWPPLTPLAPG